MQKNGVQTSVIIPSRQPEYLQKTIDDLLSKADNTIEVIVILDGYWLPIMLKNDKRVRIIHQGTVHNNLGMRAGINAGVAIAQGKYIMKIDEHCMVDQGWDTKLAADCAEDWVVIPRRYRLDPDKWELIEDGRPPIDYMYLAYPYERPFDKTCGLHGAEWRRKEREGADFLIDDTMSWQGSCWFMHRDYFNRLFPDGLDDINYGTFTQEAQEIGNTVWLSGGRLVVNKKTWYAHYHKGKRGKGYGFSREQYMKHMEGTEQGRVYCIQYWMATKEFKYDFEWLLNKFAPVPTWPGNWKEKIKEDSGRDYSQMPEKKNWYDNNQK